RRNRRGQNHSDFQELEPSHGASSVVDGGTSQTSSVAYSVVRAASPSRYGPGARSRSSVTSRTLAACRPTLGPDLGERTVWVAFRGRPHMGQGDDTRSGVRSIRPSEASGTGFHRGLGGGRGAGRLRNRNGVIVPAAVPETVARVGEAHAPGAKLTKP